MLPSCKSEWHMIPKISLLALCWKCQICAKFAKGNRLAHLWVIDYSFENLNSLPWRHMVGNVICFDSTCSELHLDLKSCPWIMIVECTWNMLEKFNRARLNHWRRLIDTRLLMMILVMKLKVFKSYDEQNKCLISLKELTACFGLMLEIEIIADEAWQCWRRCPDPMQGNQCRCVC